MIDFSGLDLHVGPMESEHRDYLEAAKRGELVLQCCTSCGRLRAAKGAACPFCAAAGWQWSPVAGVGVIYSYQIVPRAAHPAFRGWVPYPIVLVELDEQRGLPWPLEDPVGTVSLRLVANLCHVDDVRRPADEADVAIGKRVEVCFLDIDDSRALPQFRLSGDPPEGVPWRAPLHSGG